MCRWLQQMPFSFAMPILDSRYPKSWVNGTIQRDIISLCSNPESIGMTPQESKSGRVGVLHSKQGVLPVPILQIVLSRSIGNSENGIPIILIYQLYLEWWPDGLISSLLQPLQCHHVFKQL